MLGYEMYIPYKLSRNPKGKKEDEDTASSSENLSEQGATGSKCNLL
jgi:hypothetical protein